MNAVDQVIELRESLPDHLVWDERERALFGLAANQAADILRLEQDVAEHGVRLPSGRLNPALAEVRQGPATLSRLLALIDVPEAQRPSVVHARRAAEARWNGAAS